MKYYCILAINKSNPKDILGVVELKWNDELANPHIEINFIYEVKISYEIVEASGRYVE